MCSVLVAYRQHNGDPELPTVDGFDKSYEHLHECDPLTDIALIEHGSEVIGYSRVYREDLATGVRDCVMFAPTRPDHLDQGLFRALLAAQEEHLRPWALHVPQARFRAFAGHPGPGQPPVEEAAWLEAAGYEATEWEAWLVRPNLDDIPARSLPEGVETRPVTGEQIRPILEAHHEAFRGEWDFREPTEDDYAELMEHPYRDESLWKVAWAGDVVVGQVKSFINTDENEARGYQRGYTEYISTHRHWRNRGIAGALIALSLQELKDRGMTEAALGVDTNNRGGALHLYTSLGFELQRYDVVYTKAIG
jgi:ribosomal protein S18 acetylase RimI-like enzyme